MTNMLWIGLIIGALLAICEFAFDDYLKKKKTP